MYKERVVFGAMDEVVFGRPAAEAINVQTGRVGASRAFLMVSGALNRDTDEIEKIRDILGQRCVGLFEAMPPHTPREAVIAASEAACAAGADLLDDFIRGLGIPRSLREVGVGPEHFERISEQAMGTPWIPRNPRRIDGPAQVREILALAA